MTETSHVALTVVFEGENVTASEKNENARVHSTDSLDSTRHRIRQAVSQAGAVPADRRSHALPSVR